MHVIDTHAVTLPPNPRVFEMNIATRLARVWNVIERQRRFMVWPADRCPDCDELKEPEMMLCLDCRNP